MNKIVKIIMALMISLSLLQINSNEVEASSYADKLVSIAMGESGSSYKSKYGAKPWCASFISWAARSAGIPSSIIPSTSSSSGMKSSVVSLGGKVVSSPQKGDLVFYKNSRTGSICHVAIMTSSSMSIHGNYSDKVTYMDAYNYYDSNNVKTTRSRMIFVRPNYGKSTSTDATTNNSTSNNTSNSTNKPAAPKPTVTKTSISKFIVKGIESKVEYTSKAIKPTITLYDGSKKIDASNYTVTYGKNTNPGKATVTIKGKNNYTGTITKTFTILEVDYSNLKAVKASIPEELSIYTDDTVEAVNTALLDANNLKSTSVQRTVDLAVTTLRSAIDGLTIKPADYTKLDAIIQKVPSDLSDYTTDSRSALTQAIQAVVRDKLITEQEAVDQMALDIETALTNLKLNPFRSEVVVPVVLGFAVIAGVYFVMKNKGVKKQRTEEKAA